MTKMSPELRAKLTSKAARFIAYCGVSRALRGQREFLAGKPAVIVLVVPRGEDVEIYEGASKLRAYGESLVGRLGMRENLAEVVALKPELQGKRRERYDLLEASATEARLVVVTPSRDLLCAGFECFADAVLDIDPPDLRHVMAAAKLCQEIEISAEQADTIAAYPLKVIAAAWRKGRGIAKTIEVLQAAGSPKEGTPPQDATQPRLEDLHGFGEAAEWGMELAVDLADWQAGRIQWSDVDRGVLLSGPPGCGKTTFAGALARTCGVHLVLGSLARWQARGHLGDLLKAMRGAFDEAKREAPSIIFIDELDSVGDREKFSGHSAQYCREVVNGLLECLDGAGGRDGVVVVGATNYPELVDAAVKRPGRLDRHIRIPLPDLAARKGIIRFHLGGSLQDGDCAMVAERTEGWTGARLEQLARDARRRARRARRAIIADDLLSELPTLIPVPEALLRRSAVHEAGHVVVGLDLDIGDLISVALVDTFDPSGAAQQSGGGAQFAQRTLQERTRSQFLDLIATALAGLAAEEVVFGERAAGGGGGKGSDLHEATVVALQLEASYGLGAGLTYLSGPSEHELLVTLHMDADLRARVETVLTGEFSRAKALIETRRQELDLIAEELLRRKMLSADDVRSLSEPFDNDRWIKTRSG